VDDFPFQNGPSSLYSPMPDVENGKKKWPRKVLSQLKREILPSSADSPPPAVKIEVMAGSSFSRNWPFPQKSAFPQKFVFTGNPVMAKNLGRNRKSLPSSWEIPLWKSKIWFFFFFFLE